MTEAEFADHMSGLVVIKFGGGLITDKESLCTVNREVIDRLSGAVKQLVEAGYKLIVIHGAGSFGHLKAKQWQLHNGRQHDFTVSGATNLTSQDEAISSVISDMMELNSVVCDSLTSAGLTVQPHPPHQWARNTGPEFVGPLPFSRERGVVDVSYGDVVKCDGEREFGILSGDDICFRTAKELNATHMIFAMTGADGVLTCPPENADSELIPIWTEGMQFEGKHAEDIDVTGGIGLKLARAEAISKSVNSVWILNGNYPERIIEAVVSVSVPVGTRVVPESP